MNEANLVAAYAPKTTNFSGKVSLRIWVSIAAGVMTLGYQEFWVRFLAELNMKIDTGFNSSLSVRDMNKGRSE